MKPDCVFLIPSLGGGGAEHVCVRMANAGVALGRRIAVVVVCKRGPFFSCLDDGIEVVDLRKGRVRWSPVALVRSLRRFPGVPILAFGLEVAVIAVVARKLGLLDHPIYYREPSRPSIVAQQGWVANLYKLVLANVTGVIAQTDGALAELKALHPCRGVTIPNPFGIEYAPGRHDPKAKPEGGPWLVSVGRLAPEKRHDWTIRGVAGCRDSWPGAHLSIAGEGPERPRLESLIAAVGAASSVSLHGFVAPILPLLAASDVLVVASSHEGHPNVIVEALLSGCRPLVVDAPGCRDVMCDLGLRECLVPEGDFVAQFATHLGRVLALPPEPFTVARHRIVEQFDHYKIARRYLEVCVGVEPLA